MANRPASRSGHRYSGDPAWDDVEPIQQDDGGPNALATIAYTDVYREAMSYLRAVMAANEMSERVLQLTEHVISMNPAHYTVWLYRAKTLQHLNSDLQAELEYLNEVSLKHIKNYQIWHHRQFLMNIINSSVGESAFLAEMFEKDAKNYHVWSYRQWMVRHFKLWDDVEEWNECERLLRRDIRNNSAWNFRWYLTFGREMDGLEVTDEAWEREEAFVKAAIELSPQNESPWNYLRALYKKSKRPLSDLTGFAEQFVSLGEPQQVRSSFALDVLAEIYSAQEEKKEQAAQALSLLANTYDPIRANYWNYRKILLRSSTNTAAAG